MDENNNQGASALSGLEIDELANKVITLLSGIKLSDAENVLIVVKSILPANSCVQCSANETSNHHNSG